MSRGSLDPSLDRVVREAWHKRERRGAVGDARVVVPDLAAEEALALDGLLTPRKPIMAGSRLTVSLSVLEAALREQGFDPLVEYERVGGTPVRDIPAERAAAKRRKSDFQLWLAEHAIGQRWPAVREWLIESGRQGRLSVENQRLVDRALHVVSSLPARDAVQRVVLAAELLDADPHALDVGTALHQLVTSLLAVALGVDAGEVGQRGVWAAANVLVDPVSSFVVGLNLPLVGEGLAPTLARAARGTHVVLTYGQLSSERLSWLDGADCFSCENPSVLIAAEQALGGSCPPLVCTGGRPSDAVRLLFSAVARSDSQIHHHGDFDEAGVQILRDLEQRYGARPWGFDIDAWRRHATRLGLVAGSLSVQELEDVVADITIPEELLLDELLADLRAG